MPNDVNSRSTAGLERRWQTALERQPQLRRLIEAPTRTRADVEAAASQLGLHPSSLYRLLRRYATHQSAEAITGVARGWRPGNSRVPARVEAIIDAAIEDFYLTKPAPSEAALHREITKRCREAELAAPAEPEPRSGQPERSETGGS